jgi:hypothetical protein
MLTFKALFELSKSSSPRFDELSWDQCTVFRGLLCKNKKRIKSTSRLFHFESILTHIS